MSKCDTCKERCPQAERAHQAALGRMYATNELIALLKKNEKQPMTNADRIRATDDEIATMLHAVKMGYAPWCDYHCENEGDDGCDNCIKKWLQQPAEGDA